MLQKDITKNIAIAWIDLKYETSLGIIGHKKSILNGVNGSLTFGSMTGLMGPSGSGKTTLLKILSGRARAGVSAQTKIYMSAEAKNRCLIGQHETNYLIMELTVKQNMLYASKLKNSSIKKDKRFDHLTNVNNILEELMISHVEDTRVGECSGGQQKRLIVALELTAILKPSVMFIDEPTTGLDSAAALTIMKSLHRLSKEHGMAILTSTHQPNGEMLQMLDSIYVMAIGGYCVYSGRPQDITSFLNRSRIDCEQNHTPIESLMKISSDNLNDNLNSLIRQNIDSRELLIEECRQMKTITRVRESNSKWFNIFDLWYLVMRSMQSEYICRWKSLVIQMLFYVLTGLLMAIMFNPIIGEIDKCFDHLSNPNTTCSMLLNEDTRLLQNIKFIFFNSVIIMFVPICVTAITFPSNLNIFVREHRNGWYSTSCYFIAINITEALPTIVNAISFSLITFTISGQSMEVKRLFGYTGLITIGMLSSQALGYLIGVLFIKYQALAVLLAVGSYSVLTNLSNIMILTKDLPFAFQYLSRFSITKLISNSVLIIIYGWNQCQNGAYVLNKFDLKEDMLVNSIIYSIIYYILLTILSLIILLFKNNKIFGWNCRKQADYAEESIRHSSNKLSNNIMVNLDEADNKSESITSGIVVQGSLIKELKSKLKCKNPVERLPIKSNSDTNKPECQHEVQDINVEILSKKRLCIAWIDLTLIRPKSMFEKQIIILNNLYGCLEFGSMTALLGPSGAGKTSLLKTINGRQTLKLNEECKIFNSKYRKIKTCFISQDVCDHIVTGLSVEQAMVYASKLKNRQKAFDHHLNARKLMEELMIFRSAKTRVEDCSGGEQKRLVIAMEMTALFKPNFICIDEPTSGLDSNGAEVVIRCLKRVVDKHNVCIITSIHQPNVQLMAMFDNLYVLSKGGHLAYAGPPVRLNLHLAQCGIECSDSDSPIEVLIQYCCNECNDDILSKMLSKASENMDQTRDRCFEDANVTPNGTEFLSKRFFINDFIILFLRNTRQMYQYLWKYLLLKSIAILFFGYCLTLLFDPDMAEPNGCITIDEDIGKCYQSDKLKGEALITQNLYFIFIALMIFLMFELVSTTITFTSEVRIFFNEHRNNWYSTTVYYWSKAIIELIPTLITIVAYILIIDKFNGHQYFGSYFAILSLGVLCIQNIGHIIGIFMSSDLKSGLIASMVYYIILFLFSNYLVPISQLHYSLQYLSDLSIIKLMIESLIIRFYGFDRCSKREISSVLYFYKLNDGLYYRNHILLVIQLILLRILVLICLLTKNKTKLNVNKQKFTKIIDDKQTTKFSLYF